MTSQIDVDINLKICRVHVSLETIISNNKNKTIDQENFRKNNVVPTIVLTARSGLMIGLYQV